MADKPFQITVEEGKLIAFANDQKGNPKAPTHKGKCKIAGAEWEVSVWVGTTKTGSTYVSGQIQAPRQGTAPPPPVVKKQQDDDDSLIPF